LQAALENLDEKTTTILIVDDNEDDALLIRRLWKAARPIASSMPATDGKAWPWPVRKGPT